MQERNIFPNNSINSIARNSINIHEIMIYRKDLHNRKHLVVIAIYFIQLYIIQFLIHYMPFVSVIISCT